MKGSVWASLPPIKNGSTEHPKPIILAITSQDSASFFRDRSIGSDSPISVSWYWFYIVEFILLVWIKKYFSGYSQGLIALLTAVDALSHIHDLSNLKKQVWYDHWKCVCSCFHVIALYIRAGNQHILSTCLSCFFFVYSSWASSYCYLCWCPYTLAFAWNGRSNMVRRITHWGFVVTEATASY